MVLDFNINVFVENLKATKPPYDCPIPNCGRTYKTFSGIQFHIYNFDHENPDNNSPTPGKKPSGKKKQKGKHWKQKMDRPNTPPDFLRPPETLTYAEAQRLVEIDLDGRIHRINIYEPLDIVTQDVIDNQNNTEKEEKGEKSPQRHVKHPDPPQKSRKDVTISNHSNTSKLPEAQYKVIEDYVKPIKINERSDAYYRYIEKSVEELDEEVEYDMDEEVSNCLVILDGLETFLSSLVIRPANNVIPQC